MIRYISEKQLSIEEFKTPFETSLSPDNRWVELSKIVPWDKFASIYMSVMSTDMGRQGLSPRLVLGALIIKHLENLDDRGVISSIQENVYMQYFVGLKGFSTQPIFDASLFVEIRKRIGAELFDTLNVDLIKSISAKKDKQPSSNSKKEGNDSPPTKKNSGKMQADATVADQYITYPTDNGILNASRKQCEKMIDKLYALNDKQGVKPKTYRRTIDKLYLEYAKKKKKSKSTHRKMTRKLLEAVNRDIKHINLMLDIFETKKLPCLLNYKEQRMLWIINTVYEQQKQMYDNDTHSCVHRIVSIFQPHVRPIVRGKQGKQVEFGSKLGVSLDNGFARINTLSWDAYNEGGDLIAQVEDYKQIHGYYPELVQVDKIYATRENRQWLKDRGIRITASPLGRKKTKQTQTYYQKQKQKKEAAQRNHIEGKFGQAKNGYNLNKIRARLKSTSESWVACIFFIMNLLNYKKQVIFCSFFKQIHAFNIPVLRLLTNLKHFITPINTKLASLN